MSEGCGRGGGGGPLSAAQLEPARGSEGVCVNDLLAEGPAHAAADGVRLVDDRVGHRRVQCVHLLHASGPRGGGKVGGVNHAEL
jgi:hypothetical protein